MANWLLVAIMAVAFTFVLALSQTAYWWYIARQDRLQEELLRRISGGVTDDARLESLIKETEGDAVSKALGGFGARLQEYIVMADAQITVTTVVMQMAIGAAVGALVGFFFVGPIGMFLAIPAGYVPVMLLQRAGTKRAAALVSQLPDALDLMGRAMQAGVGLGDAFKLAAEELPPPLSIEFTRVFEEVRFGRDYREAFGGLVKRNPTVFDLRLMVSSIMLQRETGGNLIEILENISETIRARFTFMEKVAAMTSEARFTSYILGGLPIAVATMISLTSPDYLAPLFKDPIGNIILLVACVMFFTGVFIMRDITKVEV